MKSTVCDLIQGQNMCFVTEVWHLETLLEMYFPPSGTGMNEQHWTLCKSHSTCNLLPHKTCHWSPKRKDASKHGWAQKHQRSKSTHLWGKCSAGASPQQHQKDRPASRDCTPRSKPTRNASTWMLSQAHSVTAATWRTHRQANPNSQKSMSTSEAKPKLRITN